VVAIDVSEGGRQFGDAVAMSGTTMVVGGNGRAYLFSLNGNTFEGGAVLDANEATERFGWAVTVDGETIVVGLLVQMLHLFL
jgi:hypothetical protein